jgi:uncharacterized protein (UPF0248 family)
MRREIVFVIMFFCSWTSRPLVSALTTSISRRPSFVLSRSNGSFRPTRFAAVSEDERYGRTMTPEYMAYLYQEWTLEQDTLLWENRNKSPAQLASLLGRGLNGVQSRLLKLKDVDSPAYERFFSGPSSSRGDLEEPLQQKTKLIPAFEVLRRIQWDYMCNVSDFSILHYDRVEDTVVESRLDSPNSSISGKETQLIDALPEHRVVGVKYKERVVWDREKRIDLVFTEEGGIHQVMEDYDEWKNRRDTAVEWNRKRQAEVAHRIEQMLGSEQYAALKDLSAELQLKASGNKPMKVFVEEYVTVALRLFRQAREDPSKSNLEPPSDITALESLSELVALLPDGELRPAILGELALIMDRVEGQKRAKTNVDFRELPELSDADLTETFVRGSGPGGQKVNKTSNRVVLVHEPTQLRVECQDTRSLQQNRKLARKRLQLKLDVFLNGSESRESVKAQEASSKKQKQKAKSRARQRKKNEPAEEN